MTIESLNLTEMETATLKALINALYAEAGFSDVSADDLAETTGIDIKQIRGVLSSLVKKDIVSVDFHEVFERGRWEKIYLVYLNESHWALHPTWSQEIN